MRLNKWLGMMLAVLCILTVISAYAGDPLDTNDGPKVYSIESACGQAEKWPACQPCWTNCYYALLADAWGHGWDFD